MPIQLSDRFTFIKLLRFTIPTIVMLIFTSIYNVVDGFFVSNYVGKTSFSAVNFIMPILLMLGALGFMFGTGGSALIAKTMGEGDTEKPNRIFSFLVYVSLVCGIVIAALGLIFLRPLTAAIGADGALLEESVRYGRIVILAVPAFILQFEFQSLFSTAGKPKIGLYITVAAGLTNIVLDALFVAVFSWGLEGAAAATVISQCVGGGVPILYFALPNKSLLQLGKTAFDGKALIKTCSNGFSELLSQISMSLVSMLYNIQLLRYAGADGVAAYGVLMYVGFIFQALFIGYSVGTAPIIGYHYGAQNHKELHSLLKKSCILIGIFAVCMFASSLALSRILASLFVGYDAGLFAMTVHAFTIFAFSFLCSGYAIFGSSFFTALNNGGVSAAISFLRTVVFQAAAVLLLPLLWGVDGIWLSIVGAELMAVIATFCFIAINRKKYGY